MNQFTFYIPGRGAVTPTNILWLGEYPLPKQPSTQPTAPDVPAPAPELPGAGNQNQLFIVAIVAFVIWQLF